MIALRLPEILARLSRMLVLLGTVAVFAWVAAYWIWRVAEPAATAQLVRQDNDWAARILAGSGMGFSRAEPVRTQLASTVGAVEGRIRLMGIAREPGNRERSVAQALFKIDAKRILWLRVGEELDPGMTLAAVDANGVLIAHEGKEFRLPLRERRQTVSRGLGPVASTNLANHPVAPLPVVACKLTPEQRSRAYVLRPEIVDGVMRERSGWTDLFKQVAEGLVVRNPGGTGTMLGLYGNDIVSRADGAQLSGPEDVLRLILQPLARNESVVVAGSRGGMPREWIYAGMNCLPR